MSEHKHNTLQKGKTNKSSLVTEDHTWNTISEHWPERISRGVDNKEYKICQTVLSSAAWTVSASVPTFNAFSFYASLIDQWTQLAAVFDQYKITKLQVWIVPQTTGPTLGETASVIDYDDTTALTTFAQALDYQNCLVGKSNEGHYRSFRPHVAVAGYTGSFGGYTNVKSPWIDCTSGTVLHYGVKVASTVASGANAYDLVTRYHISFRNVR